MEIRRQVTALLSQPGLTHAEIAGSMNCSTRTIARIAKDVQPVLAEVDSKLAQMQAAISSVLTVKQRAEKYAEHAMKAKNEAVSMQALMRIDDLDGIISEKERLRSQGVEHSAPAPMFIFPNGTNINFGVVQQVQHVSQDDIEACDVSAGDTTIESKDESLHNTSTATSPIETPTYRDVDERPDHRFAGWLPPEERK